MGWLIAAVAAAIVAHAHSKASVDTPSGTMAQTGGTQVVPLAQIPAKNYVAQFSPYNGVFLSWTKIPTPVMPLENGGSSPVFYNANTGQVISIPGGSGTGGVGGGGGNAPGGGQGGPQGRGLL